IGPAYTRLQWHPRLERAITQAVGNADIVHVHALWEEAQHRAATASRRRGVPYIITPHGMLDSYSLSQSATRKRVYMRWRLRRDLDAAAAIHFTTQTERDLVRSLGLRPGEIVESLGLDLHEFDPLPARGRFRARFA